MKKSVKINNYINGYTSNIVNCIDIPIGAACGHFNYNYYEYYLFLYTTYLNWRSAENEWIDDRNMILKNIGLRLCSYEVKEQVNLISFVKEMIDAAKPVLLITKYGALFYSQYYGYGNYNHCVLVSDYDSEFSLIGIRDRETIREHIRSGFIKGDILNRLQITETMLIDIWQKANKYFKREKSYYLNKIFYLEQASEKKINSRIDLLKLLVAMLRKKKYMLGELVNNFNSIFQEDKKIDLDRLIGYKRRIFHMSLQIIFDTIGNYLNKEGKKIKFTRIADFKNSYLNYRDNILSIIHLHSLRYKKIDFQTTNELQAKIAGFEGKLLQLLEEIVVL